MHFVWLASNFTPNTKRESDNWNDYLLHVFTLERAISKVTLKNSSNIRWEDESRSKKVTENGKTDIQRCHKKGEKAIAEENTENGGN